VTGRRPIRALLLAQAAFGFLALALVALALETGEARLLWPAGALMALLLGATWALGHVLSVRDGALDQLRRVLAFAVRRDSARPEAPTKDEEIAALVKLAVENNESRRVAEIRNDARFGAAIGALSSGIVLLSPTGQISLINGKAKAVLGTEKAIVGASIFSILDRDDLSAAIGHSEAAGRAFHAQVSRVDGGAVDLEAAALAANHGALLTIEGDIAEWLPGCEHALELHDSAPSHPAPTEATALVDLPISVLDSETTGLDVFKDKIVQFAALKMQGERIFPADSIERIVDPGRPIPAVSAAVHGITDEIARAARPMAEQWDALAPFLADRVVVGHNVGYDMAMLAREAQAAGRAWTRPRTLCTARLAEALDPQETDFNLETVATRLGVETIGRHTAMGDVLVTAEIFRRQLILMRARGIATLGAAEVFARTAKRMMLAQSESGW